MSWKLQPKNVYPVDCDPNNQEWHHVWENKLTRLPQPGAQAYAFETYGLVQFSPIGPSVQVRTPLEKIQGQLYVGQAVVINGIPIQSGSIITQPLIDPSDPNPYSSAAPGDNPLAAAGLNGPNNPAPMALL